MEKPLAKLPREVAAAIERLREIGESNSAIIYKFAWDTDNNYPELVAYAARNFDTFLIALVNGYETEKTPEERAIQWLMTKDCIYPRYSEHDIVMGIKSILEGGGTE